MKHPKHTDLIGYLVGSIMPRCNSLLIAIYAKPDGRHTTSVTSGRSNRSNYENVRCLAWTFKPVLVGVWVNDSVPGWYYLQFDKEHPPIALYGWDLPRQVYGEWSYDDVGAQGLVGLSISPHDDPAPSEQEAHWLGQGKADDE